MKCESGDGATADFRVATPNGASVVVCGFCLIRIRPQLPEGTTMHQLPGRTDAARRSHAESKA